jgi:YjjG family noncanonical pyrimidine nucleotidase
MTRKAGAAERDSGRSYKCVFFDLDHTLWDYECNSRETLRELYEEFNLERRGIPLDGFRDLFKQVNFELWEAYDRGLITNDVIRTQRFRRVLAHFGVEDETLNQNLAHEFFHGCPKKATLVPHAKEILEYLSENYMLTVITNGFEEIQAVKLRSGDITHYFDHVITSQKAGHRKPSREIFEYALSVNKLECHEAIMIGDNLITDIGGARNACIDAVFYNPASVEHGEQVDHEIRCLSELRNIL